MSTTMQLADDDQVESARRAVATPREMLIVQSCVSTWFFSRRCRMFRRVLTGIEVQGCPVMTDWRRYYSLEFDPTCSFFVVWLDPERTRLLRFWRHTQPCDRCDDGAVVVGFAESEVD